jgi:hypothetical protein
MADLSWKQSLASFAPDGAIAWSKYLKRFLNSIDNSGFAWSGLQLPPHVPQPRPLKVLMATSAGGHFTALNVESVLAAALTVRGHKVQALICDGILPACIETVHALYPTPSRRASLVRSGPKELCISCTRPGAAHYARLGIDVLFYSRFLTPEEQQEAERIASSVPLSEIPAYTINGVRIGESALSGMLRFLARAELSDEPFEEELFRRYLAASLLTYFAISRLLDEGEYDVCVLNHGIYVPQGVVAEVCRKKGVRFVTWNPAYRKGCFIFSHDDTYHHTLMHEPPSTWEGIAASPGVLNVIDNYLVSRERGDNDWIKFHSDPNFHAVEYLKKIGVSNDRPIVMLLTNVAWDAQLHYPANAFPNMMDWIRTTVRWFAVRPDLQLLIRVHPAEISGNVPSRQRVVEALGAEFPALPQNVKIVSPQDTISTYALAAIADCALIYGTKMGVELSARGMPVIVAGEAWVRGKGFTIDCSDREDYFRALDRLPMRWRLPEEDIKRAKAYAFHFFYRRMIPMPFMHSRRGWPSMMPSLQTLDNLLPGRYEGLDVICDGIVLGTPFVFEAERHIASDAGTTVSEDPH